MPALLLFLDEVHEMVHGRNQLALATKDFARMIQTDFGPIDQPMGFYQGLDVVIRKIVAAQGHHIDAARPRRVSVDQHVGRHIVQHAAHSTDKGKAPDRCELMNAGIA